MRKPLQIPKELNPANENNKWLSRLKASRAPKWSFRSAVRLGELGDIACALASLGREPEAIAIGQWVRENVHFRGGYNIWSPVQALTCLCCFLVVELGDTAAARAWMAE